MTDPFFRPVDFNSCEPKAICGCETSNPGAVYNAKQPCVGNYEFNEDDCSCNEGGCYRYWIEILTQREGIEDLITNVASAEWSESSGYKAWANVKFTNNEASGSRYSNVVQVDVETDCDGNDLGGITLQRSSSYNFGIDRRLPVAMYVYIEPIGNSGPDGRTLVGTFPMDCIEDCTAGDGSPGNRSGTRIYGPV